MGIELPRCSFRDSALGSTHVERTFSRAIDAELPLFGRVRRRRRRRNLLKPIERLPTVGPGDL